jgi:N-acetylneuraminate lyase
MDSGDIENACALQKKANDIITALVSCYGNIYAVMKEIIKIREGIDLGGVRNPLPNLIADDMPKVTEAAKYIDRVLAEL